MRPDGRDNDQIRPVSFQMNFQEHAEGSVLIACGKTKVLCSASVEDYVPPFRKGSGSGWLTAEYSLLPRSTSVRVSRERSRVGGRTHEIQRLIGRVLRAALDLDKIGERSIWIDCDVIQADGGTRTASITGAYVALVLAVRKLLEMGYIQEDPIVTHVAAISVGLIDDTPLLDLNYEEDYAADVDFNVAMTGEGEFIELQGTAENKTFSRQRLDELLELAGTGIRQLIELQKSALK